MNTLNNQQINPGNRVDFSRIRRFAKGGVPKYQDTPGTLKYNWDPFYGQFQNNSLSTMNSNTSIPWNRTWSPNETYNTVQDLENTQNYKDFTNYVLNNSNNEQVMQYLKHLDSQARRSGSSEGLLFTDDNQTTLRDGWNNEYSRLRSDGKYGYFHLTPEFIQEPPVAETPDTPQPDSPIEPTTPELQQPELTETEYKASEYLPEYRKGIWTDGLHLAGIYGNNMIGALRDYNLEMKKRVPLHQASQQNAIVTDGYTERMLNKQALAEARARNAAAASNTSNADAARQMQLDFESQVGMQNEMQNNSIQAREYKTSLQNVQQVADQNTANRTAVANQNRANLIAGHNAKIDARRKLNATKTAETAGLIQNLDASLNKFNLQEKMNKQYYNQAVNDYMFNKEKSEAYNEYSNILENGHLRAGYEGLMSHLLNGGDSSITTEDLTSLRNNQGDFTKTRAILERYATSNPEIAAFLSEVDELQKQAWGAYEKKYNSLLANKSYANLFQKQYLGSYPGFNRDFLNTNWTTLFPSYKKGGKVEDRFIKYVEHTRKVLKDQDDRNKHTQTQAQKKLLRDLDALDRETLLLLRSIFK